MDRMSFTNAHKYICATRMARAMHVITDCVTMPKPLYGIILEYIMPSRLEFARNCDFVEWMGHYVIVPINSHLPDGFVFKDQFLPVHVDMFDNVLDLVKQTPYWQGSNHDANDLIHVNDVVIPFFSGVFAKHARAAASHMDDLPSFYLRHINNTDARWAKEAHRIAMAGS